MAKDENKGSRKMSNRERAKRRKELARDEIQNNNQNAKQPLGVNGVSRFYLPDFLQPPLFLSVL